MIGLDSCENVLRFRKLLCTLLKKSAMWIFLSTEILSTFFSQQCWNEILNLKMLANLLAEFGGFSNIWYLLHSMFLELFGYSQRLSEYQMLPLKFWDMLYLECQSFSNCQVCFSLPDLYFIVHLSFINNINKIDSTRMDVSE